MPILTTLNLSNSHYQCVLFGNRLIKPLIGFLYSMFYALTRRTIKKKRPVSVLGCINVTLFHSVHRHVSITHFAFLRVARKIIYSRVGILILATML